MEDVDGEAASTPDPAASEQALATLRHGWGEAYEIGRDAERGWWARRRDGWGGELTGPGPDVLWAAMFADYTARPVRPRLLRAAGGLTMRPILDVVPGGYVDQVARRGQFERGHPDAEITRRGFTWTGSLMLCGVRRQVTARDLETLLDKLDGVAALAAEAAAVERDFPAWHVWLSDLDRWYATRRGAGARHGSGDRRPMTLDADDAGALRALLGACPAPEPR